MVRGRRWLAAFLLGVGAVGMSACALIGGIEEITIVGDGGALGIEEARGSDGRRDDGSTTDAGADAPLADGGPDVVVRCPTGKPFETPVAVTELNSMSDDWSARLSPDERVVYLASSRFGHIGGASIYKATRAEPTLPFGAPVLVDGVNSTTATVVHPSFAPGELEVVLQINEPAATPNLYIAARGASTAPFGAPVPIPNVNQQESLNPFLTSDGSALWFSSNRVGGQHRIYVSSRVGGAFQTPVAVNLGTTVADGTPVLSDDGLTLYFGSSRGDASFDIYRAQRSAKSDPWGAPTPVTELNVAGVYDTPSWLSPDGCRLYFMSTRNAAQSLDIYLAKRSP